MLYQNEFGCGHLVTDKKSSFEMLEREWNSVKAKEDGKLFEQIGNGYSRMNIETAKARGVSTELFHKLFLKSAEKQTGTIEGFSCKNRKS